MKLHVALSLILSAAFFWRAAHALSITDTELADLDWSYSSDSDSDTAGTNSFKTYGMGHAIADGFLYVVVQTNFPEAGVQGNDSYTSSTHFSPGDLYLNVGGTFQAGGGAAFGIATTSHGNVVQQAYAGQSWLQVTAGSLYQDATFATGTYEQYQQAIPGATPGDGDGNNRRNSYPTFITAGDLVAGDVSGVRYRSNGASDPWAWDIFYKVSLSALGLVGGETIQSFWVMECGNDGAQHFLNTKAVPEPSTIALLAAGISAFAVRRRTII